MFIVILETCLFWTMFCKLEAKSFVICCSTYDDKYIGLTIYSYGVCRVSTETLKIKQEEKIEAGKNGMGTGNHLA